MRREEAKKEIKDIVVQLFVIEGMIGDIQKSLEEIQTKYIDPLTEGISDG